MINMIIMMKIYDLYYLEKSEMSLIYFFLGGSLLCSGLLGSLLGSRLLSSGLLSRLLGSRLLGGLLSSRLLSSLLGSGLLGLLGLGRLLCLHQLVAAGVLAAGSSGLEGTLGNSPLEGQPDLDGSLGGIDLVVGDDVLEDGGAAGAGPVLESSDGSSDHHAVLGVGGRRLLGLRGSSGGHGGGLGI